jgi:hypothetical protein
MTGLVGTLAVRIVDPGVQETPTPRTTQGINEFPAGSGIYGVTLTAPLGPGLYVVMWDIAPTGPYTVSNSWGEPLTITIEDPVFPGGWSWTPYGWLQPDWYEGTLDISTGTPGSSTLPDANYVRCASKLDFNQYGYTCDTGPGGLQELVDQALSTFWRITGQKIDQIEPQAQAIVRRVVKGMTEYFVVSSDADTIETMSDFDMISSFSAGPYNENRKNGSETRQGWLLFPIPWISQTLWGLLDYERYGYWVQLFGGINMPAFESSDAFWEQGLEMGNWWGPGSPNGYTWGA